MNKKEQLAGAEATAFQAVSVLVALQVSTDDSWNFQYLSCHSFAGSSNDLHILVAVDDEVGIEFAFEGDYRVEVPDLNDSWDALTDKNSRRH